MTRRHLNDFCRWVVQSSESAKEALARDEYYDEYVFTRRFGVWDYTLVFTRHAKLVVFFNNVKEKVS